LGRLDALFTEPPAMRERLLAVQLGLAGKLGLARIAQAAGRSRATIQTWFHTSLLGGIEALLYDARRDKPGRPSELSGPAPVDFRKIWKVAAGAASRNSSAAWRRPTG
jgi:hypothetical protein